MRVIIYEIQVVIYTFFDILEMRASGRRVEKKGVFN